MRHPEWFFWIILDVLWLQNDDYSPCLYHHYPSDWENQQDNDDYRQDDHDDDDDSVDDGVRKVITVFSGHCIYPIQIYVYPYCPK